MLEASATCQLITGMLTRLQCGAYAVELGLQNIATCARLTALHLQGAAEAVHLTENLHDLQQLVHLQELHLEDFTSLPDNLVYNLPKLQVLKLTNGHGDTYDLSGATQLTALNILQQNEPSLLRRLILPSGNAVQLQNFCLLFQGQGDPEDQQMHELLNLEAATGLQTVELDRSYPDSVREAGWPQAMPSLTSLAVSGMPVGPPREWRNYSALVKLELTDLQSTSLPDWFAQFTRLKFLKLNKCVLDELPTCIFHLTQLEQLDLSDCQSPMMIPPAIIQLADWPFLTKLYFCQDGNREQALTPDSQLHVMHLQEALGHRQGVLQL